MARYNKSLVGPVLETFDSLPRRPPRHPELHLETENADRLRCKLPSHILVDRTLTP